MKFVCQTAFLSDACQNVQRAVSTKTSIPAVEGILVKTLGSEIILTGYDLELGITTSIQGNIEESGSIIINAKVLCDILRRLPDESVSFESDERYVAVITSGDARYEIMGMSAEEYPELPSVTGGFPVILQQSLLREMVRQTIFAVAVNDSKIVHTGIRFEISENKLRLVAVDGFRLAIRNEDLDYIGEEMTFVVPSKTLSEVIKLLVDDDETISLGVGKRHIVFEVGSYSIISRLLDGDFLNYKTAIPVTNTTKVKINAREFIESIERTSLIITDKIKSPVKCEIDNNTIKISSITSLGSAKDRVNCTVEGNPVIIGFNNKFLTDALRACDTDEIHMKLNGSVSPILILPPEGEKFLYLVLPVRLKNEN